MSESLELVGGDVAVATVREHTTRASQVVTLLAIVILWQRVRVDLADARLAEAEQDALELGIGED